MPGLIIGLLASVPLFVWWKNSSKPWKKRRLLFFVLIILPLLVLYRFSGLINTFFTPFPQPPEAQSSYYYYRVEGGLGPSIHTGFVFKWDAASPEESFNKAKNTAQFFDKWAKKKVSETRAFDFDSKTYLSCSELADLAINRYRRRLTARGGTDSYISMYIQCDIKSYVPGIGWIKLEIHENGGSIKFPT